jgi:hypothetical protein
MQSAAGVKDDEIKTLIVPSLYPRTADTYHIRLRSLNVIRAVNLYPEIPTEGTQLLTGRRTTRVGGNQKNSLALILKQTRKLSAGRGLSGSLQSNHHQDGRRL